MYYFTHYFYILFVLLLSLPIPGNKNQQPSRRSSNSSLSSTGVPATGLPGTPGIPGTTGTVASTTATPEVPSSLSNKSVPYTSSSARTRSGSLHSARMSLLDQLSAQAREIVKAGQARDRPIDIPYVGSAVESPISAELPFSNGVSPFSLSSPPQCCLFVTYSRNEAIFIICIIYFFFRQSLPNRVPLYRKEIQYRPTIPARRKTSKPGRIRPRTWRRSYLPTSSSSPCKPNRYGCACPKFSALRLISGNATLL